METTGELVGPKPRQIVVNVTAEHIERAKPVDSGHCMIADAIKAALPKVQAVHVDLASIRWTDPRAGKRYMYFTPPSVQRALLRFDNGITPPPFHFMLRNPAQIVTSGRNASHKAHGLEQVTDHPGDAGTKIGGKLPNFGALPSNEPRQHKAQPERINNLPNADNDVLRGRRRAFGVRAMGRPPEYIGVPAEELPSLNP